MKYLILLLLSSLSISAQIAIRHNNISAGSPWTERYVINSPYNGIGTSVVVDYTKDSTYMKFFFPQFYYPRYAQTIDNSAPESILSIRNGDGLLVRHSVNYYSKGKSDSTYLKIIDTLHYNYRINSKFNSPTGSTLQYLKGDGSLGTFPTSNSSFSNSEGYLKVVDTLKYNNRIIQKLNIIDTLKYNNRLISKLNKIDTIRYNSRLNSKLAIVDTIKYDHRIIPKLNIVDTNTYNNRINTKLNKIDTLQYNNRIVSKQDKLSGTGFVKVSGPTISYDNSNYLTTEVDGSITNEIELPSQTSQSGKVLSTNGTSPLWITSPVGSVTNVSSSTSELTVSNQTSTPIITIVSSPKLTTSRTINTVSFDGTSNINTGIKAFQGTTQRNGAFPIFKTVTVSSGTAVFHLTDDGLSTGNALFTNGVITESINAFVSDATASFQMGYAFSNSNKTLTITVNKLTTANILTGILGQTAANGSVVTLQVWGY